MQPIVHIFRAANLAEQMLRKAIATSYGAELRTSVRPDINLTSLLVLHVLSAHSHGRVVKRGPPLSAAKIAQQLGCPRPRVSMELSQLRARRWVDMSGANRRSQAYCLTQRGELAAQAANALLSAQSKAIWQVNGERETLIRSLEWVTAEWADTFPAGDESRGRLTHFPPRR